MTLISFSFDRCHTRGMPTRVIFGQRLTTHTLIKEQAIQVDCFHCGQVCEETHWLEDKAFCCLGCKTVYEILAANNLCEYYQLEEHPGNSMREIDDKNFSYLDDESIRKKLITFDSESFSKVTFQIPTIH